ncbi:MAG: hypothetical protein ACLS5G_00110 [Streptococcus sp.]
MQQTITNLANGSRFNSDPTASTTGEVTDEGWDTINPDGASYEECLLWCCCNNLQE